ncbi:MAG: glycosyltransferase family 39 protein [Candidatus Eremiobacteraeota bacterium]|nr:glycosyltransferase family 39 protein [Candidatus Eremiobacteraeota bacterium]
MRREVDVPAPTLRLIRLGVFAFLAWLYFVRLGAGSLWDNSEPTYGEIVKELFRTGDWLTLHFNYHPWYIHPPLWFWTAAVSVAIFGLNEFALRFPAALFGLLTALVVYAAGRRLYGELAGLAGALAIGTSLEMIVLSRLATLDSMLLFFTTIATFWIFFAIRDRDRRSFWVAVIAAALGTLTKGPVALAVPVLVLAAFLAWSRRPFWHGLPWLGGAIVYLLLAGSWFAVEMVINGGGFLTAYFGSSNLGRFLSPFENQPGPFWYYLPVAVIGFFPFVAFLPKAIKTAWQRRSDDERFLISAAIVPFLFFSAAQTKLPNYIVVIFPSLAVMVGIVLSDAIVSNSVKTLRGALIFLPASLVLVTIGVIVYGESQNAGPFHALAPSLALLGWFVVPTAIATLVATYAANRVWIAPAGLALMMAGFIGVVVFSILPRTESFKPMKAMAASVMSYYRPGDKVGITGPPGGFSLLFYTEAHGITSVGFTKDADQRPQEFFRQPTRVLGVVSPTDVGSLTKDGIKLWVLKCSSKLCLVTNHPPR